MKPQHIRTLGRIVGLVAVLGMASIAAGQPLSDQQISRQLVDRLAKNDAFQNVRVSVQEHIVSLTGTVPSLWAKTTAIANARQTAALRSVMSDALTIESAESDGAIAKQIGKQIRRVSIPGPLGPHAGADIEEAIYGHTGNSFYGIFDYVNGWIDDGVVALTGYVTHKYKAGKMVELVSRVQGVREIQNQIEALPVSSFDDQLRARIARRIYGNVLTPHVRIAAPLHIIVNNLRVTLAGTVFSEVEKRQAEHIARQTFGVLSLQNNLEVELKMRS